VVDPCRRGDAVNKVKWLIAAVSLLIVLLVTYWEFGRLTTPGPLHPSHADIRELNGRFDCAACHGDESVTLTDACLVCHEVIGEQMADNAGLHGGIEPALALDCQRCHTEHTEGLVGLVMPKSFVLAGVAEHDNYKHDHVKDFTLNGRHDDLSCEQCHTLAKAMMLHVGERRFLGLSQDCAACHEDPHEGTFGIDCASCHGQAQPFDRVAAFEHTEKFELIGGHNGRSCISCHEDGSAFAIAELQEHAPQNLRTCTDCHRSPHSKALILETAHASQTTARETCVVCHDVMHESFLHPKAQMTAQLHTAGAFSLEPPHHEQDCQACHTEIGTREPLEGGPDLGDRFAKLFPAVAQEDCGSCHEDPHAKQFDAGPTAGRCLECHDPMQFTPGLFDIERHAQTDFALTGSHDQVECAKCHETINGVQQFAGVSMDCASCHEDVHRGQFNDGPTGGRCDACHDTAHFQPTGFDQVRHAETDFPLDGAHQAVGCRDCHVDAEPTRIFVSTPMDCAECHEDVHDGLFDGPGKPVSVNGERGCARCHITDGFDRINWTGDAHGVWTGYELVGAHAQTACTDCHTDRADPQANREMYASLTRDCNACHTDPHAGQFRVEGVIDCARCHSPENAFGQTPFDHQTQTRFELDESHRELDCGACHKTYTMADGFEVVRYKPLGILCQDCHGFESYEERVDKRED